MLNRRVAPLVLIVAVVLVPPGLHAAEGDEAKPPKPLQERALWRLEIDNDGFVHSDNAYTNGGSIQRHSPMHESWEAMEPSGFSGWISRTIPGLGDGGDRVVKRGSGLTQVMMTPEDISNPDPQPGDIPWAGALGWSDVWYSFNDERLNAFQIYVGILGPYSLAEPFQIWIHDLINADDPRGWDNQLKTEPLLNLNYSIKRKIYKSEVSAIGFATDLAMGVEAGLGNFMTYAEGSLEWRIGWKLPRGFVATVDPPASGVMLDPKMGAGEEFSLYFSIVARVTATGYTVFYDGNTFGDSPHPGLEYDTVSRGAVFGLHVAKGRWAVHFNFNSYESLPFETVNPLTDLAWGNITFEYHF